MLACLIYGSWAAFSNFEFGMVAAAKAFSIQGLFAFVATLSLGLLAKTLYWKWGKNVSALIASFLVCFTIICTVPTCLHWFAGTPNITQSILPGLVWGSFYLAAILLIGQKDAQID
jgi:hypothetical protein